MKIYSALDDTGIYNEKFRLRGTYLHGELEREMGYDIFCFEKLLVLMPGKHKFVINGKPATLFLWEHLMDSDRDKWRGYLVYDNDEEYSFCENNYEIKKQLI